MPLDVISTPDAAESSLYSQAVIAGNTVYVAGTTGIDVRTGDFAGQTVIEQARQALLNCQAILRAAGAELSDAVMVHSLLNDVRTLTTLLLSSESSTPGFSRRNA